MRRLGIALLLGVSLSACVQTRQYADTQFAPPQGDYKLLVMRPDVSVGSVTTGGLVEARADWTETARAKLLDALRAQQATRGGNVRILDRRDSLPGISAETIAELEARKLLDRKVELLPSDAALAERAAHNQPLTRAEIGVLLAYAKMVLLDDLVASPLPDDPYLERDLLAYFPDRMAKKYAAEIAGHRLRREIIATQLANEARMLATSPLKYGAKYSETVRAINDTAEAARGIATDVARVERQFQDLYSGDLRGRDLADHAGEVGNFGVARLGREIVPADISALGDDEHVDRAKRADVVKGQAVLALHDPLGGQFAAQDSGENIAVVIGLF